MNRDRANLSNNHLARSGQPATTSQEFHIRVPKINNKAYNVMRFNGTLNVDIGKWGHVKLERENNLKEFRSLEEEQPKFGAGSEYNRDHKEELRRKKFGIRAAKYSPEAQPWLLKIGAGKSGKKFKGLREGGVGENSAFYVFTHSPDGGIDAFPLKEWYNFQPIQRYKTLTAEEAEAEFGKQTAKQNFWSVMLRKRMRNNDEEEEDADEAGTASSSRLKTKELKISEMDEWIDSDADSESGEEAEKKKADDSDDESARNGRNAKKKSQQQKKKRDKTDADSEAFEESDDGDNEGLEMDYDTSSSDDNSDLESKQVKELRGVSEEDALRTLLDSDEDDEEAENKSNASQEDDTEVADKKKAQAPTQNKKKLKKVAKEEKAESSSEFTSHSSDSEVDEFSKKQQIEEIFKRSAARSSRLGLEAELTGSDQSISTQPSPSKRACDERNDVYPKAVSAATNGNAKQEDYGITEDVVRRYLKRKPLTPTELLTKFKSKKTGVSSDHLVETMTKILKKIDPQKHTIRGRLYLWLK